MKFVIFSKSLYQNLSRVLLGIFILVIASCQSLPQTTDLSFSGEQIATVLKPLWVFNTLKNKNSAFRKVNFFAPIVQKNIIIVGNAIDNISAYDKNSKQKIWTFSLPFGVEASGATLDDYLYFGGLDGNLYCLNILNGALVWKFETKSEITSQPLIEGSSIYFLNGANSLFSLDLKTGKQNWVFSRQTLTTQMSIRGASKPTYANGIIYAGFSDGALVALNSQTGTQQWEVTLNKNIRFKDIDASPVVDGDRIYLSSFDDHVYCLSKSNGSIVWKAHVGGATAPLLVGQKLFIGSSKGSFYSLNKSNGEINWKKTDINGIASEPSLLNGFVVFGESQGRLRILDLLSGLEKASFDPGKGIMSKVSVIPSDSLNKSKLYFISGEANFYELEMSPKTKGMIPYLRN